ncbi:MAG: hypothetical protein NTV80_27150 [Verrucomicrobia bacterium]|nr:hypothetical protein [Verrucomicrobiota bacterium]
MLTPVIEGRWLDGFDVAAVLSRIRCPALLLQADPTVGGALNNADADIAVAALPSCQCVRFPGTGHQLHRDRPLAVLQSVQDFAASFHFPDNKPTTDQP